MPSKCACGCGEQVGQAGCFKPNCPRPAGTSRDPEGKIKAQSKIDNAINNPIWSPINNPINNPIKNPIHGPINNAKRQKRAHEEAVARIALMSKFEKPITWARAVEVAREIMESVGDNIYTMGVTVEEFLNIGCHTEPFPFYLGYTAQKLVDEALRWLTTRGANWEDADGNRVDEGARNRPVLLWPDGSTISI